MLTREEDIDVHALRRQGMSISAIARHLGRDRKTIRAYLAGGRVAGERKPAEADPFEAFVDYVRARLTEDPHLWAVTPAWPPRRVEAHRGGRAPPQRAGRSRSRAVVDDRDTGAPAGP